MLVQNEENTLSKQGLEYIPLGQRGLECPKKISIVSFQEEAVNPDPTQFIVMKMDTKVSGPHTFSSIPINNCSWPMNNAVTNSVISSSALLILLKLHGLFDSCVRSLTPKNLHLSLCTIYFTLICPILLLYVINPMVKLWICDPPMQQI